MCQQGRSPTVASPCERAVTIFTTRANFLTCERDLIACAPTLARMEFQDPRRSKRAFRLRLAVGVTVLATLGATLFLTTSKPARAPVRPVERANIQSLPGGEPIPPQVITSRAVDKYDYVADILRQLSTHPHATCRDDITGPQGLSEELAKARSLRTQGRSEDALLVLTGVERRLDLKFKLDCIRLG